MSNLLSLSGKTKVCYFHLSQQKSHPWAERPVRVSHSLVIQMEWEDLLNETAKVSPAGFLGRVWVLDLDKTQIKLSF
jgi:hypothetical protein